MVYFTSDTHYNHKNICRGVSDWSERDGKDVQKTRNFRTLSEMNDAIVNAINSVVKIDDTLYHLGDWSFGGIESIWNFRKRILCKDIHLIFGNHDEKVEANMLLPNCHSRNINPETREFCEEIVDGPNPMKYKDSRDQLFGVYAQELFSSVSHYKELKSKQYGIICLSHYAHRVWNKSHRGAIHLYGHSHDTIPNDWGKSMDVGVDTRDSMKPYSMTEILEIMNKREVHFVDHHSKTTN